MDGHKLAWEGIELVWVVLGFFGAAIGLGSIPQMSRPQLWTALMSGVVLSAMAPQWANFIARHMMPSWVDPITLLLPSFMTGSIAFVFGIGGMFIVPGIIVFWREFGINPWGWFTKILDLINRARGITPPPEDKGDH